jgi:hypothetical protein
MTATANHSSSWLIRGAHALCAASFLFFLLYSTPHRVHHFFEQLEAPNHGAASDHHGKSERRDPPSSDSNCVFQVSANRCAIGLTLSIQPLMPLGLVQRLFIFQKKTPLRQFLSAPFQIRAPPIA